jgi:hypothetical protein
MNRFQIAHFLDDFTVREHFLFDFIAKFDEFTTRDKKRALLGEQHSKLETNITNLCTYVVVFIDVLDVGDVRPALYSGSIVAELWCEECSNRANTKNPTLPALENTTGDPDGRVVYNV